MVYGGVGRKFGEQENAVVWCYREKYDERELPADISGRLENAY